MRGSARARVRLMRVKIHASKQQLHQAEGFAVFSRYYTDCDVFEFSFKVHKFLAEPKDNS